MTPIQIDILRSVTAELQHIHAVLGPVDYPSRAKLDRYHAEYYRLWKASGKQPGSEQKCAAWDAIEPPDGITVRDRERDRKRSRQ